jgi:hypothetical protein
MLLAEPIERTPLRRRRVTTILPGVAPVRESGAFDAFGSGDFDAVRDRDPEIVVRDPDRTGPHSGA